MKKTLEKIISRGKRIALAGMLGLGLALGSCNLYPNPEPEKEILLRDGDYPGIIVPVYSEEKASESEINREYSKLVETTSERGVLHESIQEWFNHEAVKYGKKINIPLKLCSEQIKIPEEFMSNSEYPIDIYSMYNYLRENYPDLRKYDFIALMYKKTLRDYAETEKRVPIFIVDYVGLSSDFAHEFLHFLGAKDKYRAHEGVYDNQDIMRKAAILLDKLIIISEPTAEEIGW